MILAIVVCGLASCQSDLSTESPSEEQVKLQKQQDHKLFHATLRKHLKATADKDLTTLSSMMNPDGLMHMIRPNTPVIYSTESYLKFHESWFQDTQWSINTSITDSQVGDEIGMAVVLLRYEVPNRNGYAYWKELNVSYVLKKYGASWYVISDHSSAIRETPIPDSAK